jgi:excisionase family DNA binding protein
MTTMNLRDDLDNSEEAVLLSREQAARRLDFSTRKLQREVKAGKIPCVRLGGQLKFIPADIEAYIFSHRIGGG